MAPRKPTDETTDAEAANDVPALWDGIDMQLPERRDPVEVQRDILSRMAAATTLDELFDVHGGTSSDDLIGRRFRITDVTWSIYDSDKGPLPLAQVASVDLDTGQKADWITTATNLTGFLAVAQRNGLLPVEVKVDGVKTRSGNTALVFRRPS